MLSDIEPIARMFCKGHPILVDGLEIVVLKANDYDRMRELIDHMDRTLVVTGSGEEVDAES
jgi:hypothetical protein